MSEDEIAIELKSQGVTSVKRFTRKEQDRIVQTTTYLLTFALPKVPSSIKAGYFNIEVDVYIPTPLRCYNCQKFGHGARSCTKSPTCCRCSKTHESMDTCTDDIKCANCNGDHFSSSKSCPFFQKQSQIIKLKYTNNISFSEAIKLLTTQTHPIQSASHSYSAAVTSSQSKVDRACQTDICWVTDKQSVTPEGNKSSTSASQTVLQSGPQLARGPETVENSQNSVKLTNKEKKQSKKKGSRTLKHVEVPSPLTSPVEVHNNFEPLDMEVTPSPTTQRRGSSSRSRSPVQPP
ncbi:uncharacterized protein [Haliotis asinina]|uniref:uncharacterized protein n=1 Tax=Haliotis asinina TaxID=109174 RepID=UPI003531E080